MSKLKRIGGWRTSAGPGEGADMPGELEQSRGPVDGDGILPGECSASSVFDALHCLAEGSPSFTLGTEKFALR